MKTLSRVRLFATPWTAAHQASPSMRFSRQKYWSGVPLPSLTAFFTIAPIHTAVFSHLDVCPACFQLCAYSLFSTQKSSSGRSCPSSAQNLPWLSSSLGGKPHPRQATRPFLTSSPTTLPSLTSTQPPQPLHCFWSPLKAFALAVLSSWKALLSDVHMGIPSLPSESVQISVHQRSITILSKMTNPRHPESLSDIVHIYCLSALTRI